MRALLDRILAPRSGHPLRVAIDGPDAAGKTTLADTLAAQLAGHRLTIRVSIDGFHHPRHVRYRRGPLSPEGYYHEVAVRRALVRDAELLGGAGAVRQRYRHRYLPGQRLYREQCAPAQRADFVMDTSDLG